jgi:hypothetical protein
LKNLSFSLLFLSVFAAQVSVAKLRVSANVTAGKMQFNGSEQIGFTETQLGLSYPISSFAQVQASGLVRFADNDEKYFGAQLSLPVTTSPIVDSDLVQTYIAPGFRTMRGYEALLVEGGVSLNYSDIGLGLGYRLILNEVFDNGLQDESQVFFYSTFNGLFNF